MYEPPDFTVLPTSNEILHSKDVIQQMGNTLMETMLDPKPAPERVAELEDHQEVLKAWIAPIKRLNDDILSLIFEFCGEDDPKMTLHISAVSRGWRQVVLATPRAWAYLNMSRCLHPPTVALFFKCSRSYPLHVNFDPWQCRAPISNVLDRIVCLSLVYHPHALTRATFPHVTRLWIHQYGRYFVRLSEMDTTVFPALRHFLCGAPITDNGIGEFTSPSGIAPLETLSLCMAEEPTWLRVLHSCQDSLVSLQLVLVEQFWTLPPKFEVVLPLLKCLEVQFWAEAGQEWPLDLKTPALETYWQHLGGDDYGGIRHYDINTVTQLCIDRWLELPSLPKLRLLRVCRESDVIFYLRLISADPMLFPELERIELEMEGDMSKHVLLAAGTANAERLQPILLSARKKYSDLKGAVLTLMVRLRLPRVLSSC